MNADASWVEGADGSGFGLAHLPYGVFRTVDAPSRIGVAIGDRVLDLGAVARAGLFAGSVPDPVGLFTVDRLNPFLAAGPRAWIAVRDRLTELLAADAAPHDGIRAALVPRASARLGMPFAVADYVDFYSSLEHATNVGHLFRPDADPLLPNWRHLPVAYHGRAGTVVPSGAPIVRPSGQRRPSGEASPVYGPSQRLDLELELGFVTGPASRLGEPVPIERVADHIFGVALVNDWSARDIQAWEYQPLGPFLGKSFATTIAPWVTPLAALEPFRVPPPPQEPPVLGYLRTDRPWAFDLDLEVGLRSARMVDEGVPPDVVSRASFAGMYWTMAQQLAHATANGASVRTGDLYASGTVSGPGRGSEGSLLELTLAGREPLRLSDGSERAFLADGDEVVLRGCGSGDDSPLVTLADVIGTISPAHR